MGALSVVGSVPATAQGDFIKKSLGSFSGRTYYVYVPSSYDGSSSYPMMVMLHGCTQDGEQFADETKMNQVAENNDFLVLYPETTEHNNDCWRWWDDSHRKRGNGEAADIAQMVSNEKDEYEVDDQKVYVAGLSAGGAMAFDLASAYPDVFAGAGVHAGLLYEAADDESDAWTVMSMGVDDPVAHGTDAYNDMEANGVTSRLPTIVVHGTDDTTVDTVNGHQQTEQATQTDDLATNDSDDGSTDYEPESVMNKTTSAGMSYTIKEYEDSNDNVVVKEYIVDGMDHAWAGGATGGEYTEPDAPNGSKLTWEFLSTHERDSIGSGDTGDDGDEEGDGPTADVAVSSMSVDTETSVDFDGSGSSHSNGSIESYEWAFGDGTSATGETASHTYAESGSYTATLTVTGDGGKTDKDSVEIDVSPANAYCGTATNSEHVEQGRAYESWWFYYAEGSDEYIGYGGSSNTTLKETSDGYYEQVDESECASTPTADAAASTTSAEVGEDITFDGSGSTHPDNDIQSYGWDFDDGNTQKGETVTHSFDSDGSYDVELTVHDSNGDSDTDVVTIEVSDGGDDDGDGDLYCGVDTHENHVDAGRAYNSGGCYYAEGSDQYMGSCMASDETQLEETSEGYFEVETGNC